MHQETLIYGSCGSATKIRDLSIVCISIALNITNLDEKEPIVYHGYTLTTKLPFREVVHAIKVAI